MKKFIIILALLISGLSGIHAADPIWAKTFGLKATITDEWPNEWLPCSLDIKFDVDYGKITVYSAVIQYFTITTAYNPYVQGSDIVYKHRCRDGNNNNCNVYLFYSSISEVFTSMVIQYSDAKYAYKLY